MITKIPNFIRASDFRQHLAKYLKLAEKEPVVISTDRGGSASVVINAEIYNKLVDAYEDATDARVLANLATSKEKPIAWKRARYGI